MATLREMIYDVKERVNAYTDDDSIQEEHIAFMILSKRNLYLKNYMSNLKKEVPEEVKQLICLNLTLDTECEDEVSILKSTVKIPESIETSGRSNIQEIFLPSRLAKYINIVDYIRIPYLSSGRLNARQIYFAIDPNNYLVVLSSSMNHEFLETVKLNIVANNPEEAHDLSCEASSQCDFYDAKFPIESSMISLIISEVVQELIFKFRAPTDTVNDAENNVANNFQSNIGNDRRRRFNNNQQ